MEHSWSVWKVRNVRLVVSQLHNIWKRFFHLATPAGCHMAKECIHSINLLSRCTLTRKLYTEIACVCECLETGIVVDVQNNGWQCKDIRDSHRFLFTKVSYWLNLGWLYSELRGTISLHSYYIATPEMAYLHLATSSVSVAICADMTSSGHHHYIP